VGDREVTKAVYVIGGAGAGKSTFMADLFTVGQFAPEPLEDFHSKRNAKALVTLRGHRLWVTDQDGLQGLYIGLLRDQFPGTDGLDRATSPTGEEWLREGKHEEFDFIVSEGNTLGTRRFLTALHDTTDLLLVHLWAEEFVKELRFYERGSDQSMSFVTATATRSKNLLRDMNALGVKSLNVDTTSIPEWDESLEACVSHLQVG
jgi:hypothetical protein